ncbi:MAG: VpsF family polysaccharide biosynthesis protein [Hyphomicrobiales bacterium]|nr:VpsF family polysaccharide biosynthesis protein [Hyphomicrobiales bacterium]
MENAATGEARGARSTPHDGRRQWATAVTFLAALTVLLVSGAVLTRFGVPYGSAGGPMPAKIHPATYLALAAVLVRGWADGGLGRLIGPMAVKRPGLVVFALGTVLLLFQTAVVVKLPLAPVVDTFVLPLALFVVLIRLDDADRRRLETLLHLILATNAALGLVEFASGWRLTPMYETDGRLMTYEWRASALFGHPLVNAFVTGDYIVALAFGATPRLGPTARLALIGLSSLSMLAFGGRVAMVTALAMLALAVGLGAIRTLAGRRFRLSHALIGVAMATVGLIFVVVFLEGGGADRFLSRFSDDHGSAQTRLSMLKIFGTLTDEQFLLWPDADLIWQAQREHAIRIGVESSEVGFVANYGLLPTLVFFGALAAFLGELVRATSRRALWPIAYFVLVMSTSLGIAAKTTVIGFLVLLTLTLTPRTADDGGLSARSGNR